MQEATQTEQSDVVQKFVAQARTEVAKVVVGQGEAIDHCLLAVLGGGHALLEGVPGIAKTLMVKTLASIVHASFNRVQSTSDLLPADIIGTAVFNPATASFSFHAGPLFTDFLLVDEINRMPPRTQAALLEAMQERHATVDGKLHPLPANFIVFATQNPIEFEGTYPLPEAQLDRFFLKILVRYPNEQEEVSILERHKEGPVDVLAAGLQPLAGDVLYEARKFIQTVRVEPALVQYLSKLIRKTRDWPTIGLGASPRAAVNLLSAARCWAAMEGRNFVIPDDIKAVWLPVLRHRITLRPEAELEGVSTENVLRDLLKSVEVPR